MSIGLVAEFGLSTQARIAITRMGFSRFSTGILMKSVEFQANVHRIVRKIDEKPPGVHEPKAKV